MRAVDVERFTRLVLHSRSIVHSALRLVVDGIGANNVFWALCAFVYFFLCERRLVEPVKVFRVDRKL